MNLRKNFWYATVLFLLIFLTACDNNTNTPVPTPLFPGCSEGALISNINLANTDTGPDIIHLDPGCTYTLSTAVESEILNNQTHHSGLPTIISDITIYGHNAVIDIQRIPGEPPIGHFYIDGTGDDEGDLKLYDLSLINGLRQVGGSVIVREGDLYASNTKFIDNGVGPMDLNDIQPGLGGAIYNLSGSVTIIDQSYFRGNFASKPPDQTSDLGGAIYNKNGNLTVYSTTFLMNLTAGMGGAIYSEKDSANFSGGLIVIEESYFAGNQASQDGGAIALVNESNGATFITDSKFSANTAAFGGAIFSEGSELRADFDTFVFNSADYGGVIYIKGSGGGNPSSLSSEESIYEDNMVRDLGIGGAIFSENSDLFLDGSEFIRNTASSCGAIRIGGHPTLEGEAGWADAEISTDIHIPSIIEISGSSFLKNQAWFTHGGAICHLQGELSIQDSEFINNQALEYGGALLLVDKSDIIDSHFIDNSALVGGGTAIGYPSVMVHIPGESDFVDPATLNFTTQITNSNVIYNRARTSGAGIFVNVDGRVSISKSTFTINIAGLFGGGIYQDAGYLTITNSTFSENSASSGGGLYNNGCSPTHPVLDIKHSTFAHNIASYSEGGGGLQYMGDVNVQNSLVTLNSFKDCRSGQCGLNNFSVAGSVDSDGSCAFPVTETDPKIDSLSNNGGATQTHALQSGSPLINTAPDCANLTDDQRGVHRPLPDPGDCDPGSYEFDPSDSPTAAQMEPSPTPDPEISTSLPCDLFDELQYSLNLSNIPYGTTNLTLNIKLTSGDPVSDDSNLEIWDSLGEMAYIASLGDTKAEGYQEEGYPNRIYFHFQLPESAPGNVRDFSLFRDGCDDPLISIPRVTIPEQRVIIPEQDIPDPDKPSLVCKIGLDKDSCKKASGDWVDGGAVGASYCDCK